MHCKRRLTFAIALALLASSAGPSAALTVTSAKIAKGAIQVKGRKAAPNATITWEGEEVAEATRSGRFRFATTTLPEDCVGEVGDESEVVQAVVKGCGPVGPPGEQGADGPPGTDGAPGPVLRDQNGLVLGALSSFGDTFVVLRNVGDKTVGLRISLDAIEGTSCCLNYVANDCTGEPLLRTASDFTTSFGMFFYTVAAVHDGTLYYAPGDAPEITVHSRRNLETDGCSGFTSTGPFGSLATEDISAFVPPFTVVLE